MLDGYDDVLSEVRYSVCSVGDKRKKPTVNDNINISKKADPVKSIQCGIARLPIRI